MIVMRNIESFKLALPFRGYHLGRNKAMSILS